MIRIEPMEIKHINEVYEIEKNSFSIPWTKQSLTQELLENKIAIYIMAVEDNNILGYAGMWHVVTEGHITNIAVKEECRKRGVGSALLKGLINIAEQKGMIGLTLEVRVGNAAAMKLYSNYGFKVEGYRKEYYSDTKEDAVVMWKYLNIEY